jgi:tetratricopeptide (TPR) repeat protein
MKDNQNSKPSSSAKEITAANFLRIAKANLREGKQKEAFMLLQQAAVRYPENPLILSYFGCLQALVDKKYRSGIETCRRAIALLRNVDEDEKEQLYGLFYLNLGRAYLAAGKKQDAISAYTTGVKHDSRNSDLHRELERMGKRKRPPVSFLARSNPINKIIGMILHVAKKVPEKPQAKGTRKS